MDGLVLEKLDQFFGQFKSVQYRNGETILRADDDPPGVFYLKKGFVRLYAISEEGRELTFNIFKPGSYFSMMWAIAELPNSYFFEAITPVEVWRAPKEEVIQFVKKEPEILFELTKRILVGLSGLLEMQESLLFGNAYNKVATVLVMIAKRFGGEPKNGQIVIQLPLTHQNIASLAGLTRETTSLIMKKLEKETLVNRQNGLWVIKKIESLEEKLLTPKEEKPLPQTF